MSTEGFIVARGSFRGVNDARNANFGGVRMHASCSSIGSYFPEPSVGLKKMLNAAPAYHASAAGFLSEARRLLVYPNALRYAQASMKPVFTVASVSTGFTLDSVEPILFHNTASPGTMQSRPSQPRPANTL